MTNQTTPELRPEDEDRRYRRTMHRLTLVTLLVVTGAISLPLAVAAAGGEAWWLLAPTTLGIAAWSTTASLRAHRLTSSKDMGHLDLQHMLVWANWSLAVLVGAITWMLATGDAPSLWWVGVNLVFLTGATLLIRSKIRVTTSTT